jgi:hypothetical protein
MPVGKLILNAARALVGMRRNRELSEKQEVAA